MFDIISFILGKKSGTGRIEMDGNSYNFEDKNNDGNVEITEKDGGE